MRRNIRAGIRLKYLGASGRWPSGNRRWYLRAPGQKAIPMPNLPIDSPKFLAAYAAAMGGTKPSPVVQHAGGSLGHAIRSYLASDDFMMLAPSTRLDRRRILEKIEAAYGRAQLAQIQPRHIRTDLAKHQPNPANNRLKCWRAVMSWAVQAGALDTDPAKQVAKRKAPKTDGHEAWTRLDLEKFRAHWPHDTPQRLFCELLYRSCAAVVDACALGRSSVKDGWITYRRSKSKSMAVIPWTRENAPDWFEWTGDFEICLRSAPIAPTFTVTARGLPRSQKAVSSWFSSAATAAGIDPRKSAHGLRKLRAAMFREMGASKEARRAILGHETDAEAEHYDKSADLQKVVRGA